MGAYGCQIASIDVMIGNLQYFGDAGEAGDVGEYFGDDGDICAGAKNKSQHTITKYAFMYTYKLRVEVAKMQGSVIFTCVVGAQYLLGESASKTS